MRIVDYATATHAGRVRRKNEDAYFAEPPLFAVADGMGGARAGELASRISVQTLGELVAGGQRRGAPGGDHPLANRRVAERATEDPRASGMGSTVTAALVGPTARRVRPRRRLARLPLARRRADAALGRPLAGRRVGQGRRARARGGRGAPAALRDHARARRGLADRGRHVDDAGARGRRDPALHGRPLRLRRRRGDRARRCASTTTLDGAVNALVDAANATGGEDNVTAVALRLEPDEGAEPEPAQLADGGRRRLRDGSIPVSTTARRPARCRRSTAGDRGGRHGAVAARACPARRTSRSRARAGAGRAARGTARR